MLLPPTRSGRLGLPSPVSNGPPGRTRVLDIAERDLASFRGVGYRLADQHFAGPRVIGHAGGEIHRLAEVVALLGRRERAELGLPADHFVIPSWWSRAITSHAHPATALVNQTEISRLCSPLEHRRPTPTGTEAHEMTPDDALAQIGAWREQP